VRTRVRVRVRVSVGFTQGPVQVQYKGRETHLGAHGAQRRGEARALDALVRLAAACDSMWVSVGFNRGFAKVHRAR
jgi:hypothetical protein